MSGDTKHPALEGWEIRVSELPGPAFEFSKGNFLAEGRMPKASEAYLRTWSEVATGETREEAIEGLRAALIHKHDREAAREQYRHNRRNPISQEVIPA